MRTNYGCTAKLASAKAVAAAIALFVLTNCATQTVPPAPMAALPPAAATPEPAQPVPAMMPAAEPAPAPEVALLPPAPEPPPPPPPPPPTDAQSLRAAYGAPDFIRRETDSELWRYDAKSCAVFFFLYREGNRMLIRYAETSPRGKESPADAECVRGLSARPGARAASMRMS
jgi:hypothetical protein